MHDVNAHLTDEQLSLLLDDRVDPVEVGAVNGHLQSCDQCNRSLQELTATVQALRALPVPPLPRSFQIPEPSRASLWSRLFGSGMALQGLAAAAAALFVVLLSTDMWTESSRGSIVPLVQPVAEAPKQSLQATTLPNNQPAAAGRASQAAPAAARPAAPAAVVRAAPTDSANLADDADTAQSLSASDRSEGARLESLTARNGSAAAAGAFPHLSAATKAVGFVVVILIIAAVARTVRRA
jgi:hypothetical protein